MGYYVNPPTETKESFLAKQGVPASNNNRVAWSECPKGSLPVVLIDNGMFTAAGIAYSEAELQVFTRPDDTRRRKIFFVEITKLLQVSGGDFASYVGKNNLV